MRDDIITVSISLIIWILLFTLIWSISYFINRNTCLLQFKDFNPSYSVKQGCMINYRWYNVPAKNLRVGNID